MGMQTAEAQGAGAGGAAPGGPGPPGGHWTAPRGTPANAGFALVLRGPLPGGPPGIGGEVSEEELPPPVIVLAT
jgi:hypothetical protein